MTIKGRHVARSNNYDWRYKGSNSYGTNLWGNNVDYSKEEDRPPVQIITSRDEDPKYNPEPLRNVNCPNCGNRMGFTQAKMWFCPRDLTTLNKDYDSLPGDKQQIDLSKEPPKPALISLHKPKPLQNREVDPDFQVSGNLRRAHVVTKDLGKATEENIRKALAEDEAYVRY